MHACLGFGQRIFMVPCDSAHSVPSYCTCARPRVCVFQFISVCIDWSQDPASNYEVKSFQYGYNEKKFLVEDKELITAVN